MPTDHNRRAFLAGAGLAAAATIRLTPAVAADPPETLFRYCLNTSTIRGQNLGIVAEACDRVAVMYAGKIAEEGPARQVFSEPAHPYTRELLRSTISLSTTGLHYIPGAPPDLVDPPPACRFHPRCPDAMRVCAERDPVEVRTGEQRVLCWLHGPEDRIPPGGHAPLERREIALAEEA